jgi:hypothetical protein
MMGTTTAAITASGIAVGRIVVMALYGWGRSYVMTEIPPVAMDVMIYAKLRYVATT